MKTRSMHQKITIRLFVLSLLGFLFATVLATSIFYTAFHTQMWRALSSEANAIASLYDNYGDVLDMSYFASDDLRITHIAADQSVLYESSDSLASASTASCEEIALAFAEGTGTALRLSQSSGEQTYYYALLLADGTVLRIAQGAQSLWAIFHRSLPVILFSALIFLILAGVISYWSTKKIIAPIMEMTRDLAHIQNNVPYKELSPFVSAIYSDRLLRENNEKIRQEFTANVSHELKSPLTSISGYAELIKEGMAKHEDIPTFATRIHTEALRMITLVEDILRLSQLDTMRETVDNAQKFEPLNLYDLGAECVERQSLNARRAYTTLVFEGEDAIINGNRQLLTELFQNLCDNAIRYNRPGGKVVLHVGRTKDNIPYMRVRDNGIGIPKEAQTRIFERFYRVDKSHSKATGGTGLGLAIVKHIALVHDARIELESELGKGTEITVYF